MTGSGGGGKVVVPASLFAERAAVGLNLSRDFARDFAVIHRIGASVHQRTDDFGQIGLLPDFARGGEQHGADVIGARIESLGVDFQIERAAIASRQ